MISSKRAYTERERWDLRKEWAIKAGLEEWKKIFVIFLSFRSLDRKYQHTVWFSHVERRYKYQDDLVKKHNAGWVQTQYRLVGEE